MTAGILTRLSNSPFIRRFADASGTGSWADSPRSVIWTISNGKRHASSTAQQSWTARIGSLAVIVILMLLSLSNLIDVYGASEEWAITAITATLLGAAIALAGLVPSLRLWWQLVFLAGSQFLLGPIITLPHTTIAHVIPGLDTISQGWYAMLGSFTYLISIDPPVGTADGSLMAVWSIGLLLTFLSGSFAMASNAWLSLASVLPLTAAMASCALLGTSAGWHRAVSGIIAAILLIVWLSWRVGFLEWKRWAPSLIILVLAAVLAIVGTMAVPQHRLILRDYYEPPINPYDYTSPLSGMRSYFKNHKDDVLLSVTGLPAGTPVRLAVMDRFDGSVWNLSDSAQASDSSDYRRVGSSIATQEQGRTFTATFRVHQGLGDTWLPLAGAATRVRFAASDDADSFYYNSGTDSAIFSAGLRADMTYSESGVLPTVPSTSQISNTPAAHINQPPADDVPDAVGKFATAVAGGQATGGAAAETIAKTLKDSGWFSHGLQGDYPSEAGHGSYRINALLTGTAMVGDSEQYASAMALMVRELGIPSRVVMGFLPKDSDGSISKSRTTTTSDHTTTIAFTGNDVAAWVEIKLNDYGWVAFYPTPKETKVPDDNQNLVPPKPQTLVRQPPVPLTNPLRDQTQAKGLSSLSGVDADPPVSSVWDRVWNVARPILVYGSPLWALILVCTMILAYKAVLLARARRRGSPKIRVAAGWEAIRTLALQSGVSARGTRREQARDIAHELHTSPKLLQQLSRDADYVTFSGQNIPPAQADRYWNQVDAARAALLHSLPWLRRLVTLLSIKGIVHNADWRAGTTHMHVAHPAESHHETTRQDRQQSRLS